MRFLALTCAETVAEFQARYDKGAYHAHAAYKAFYQALTPSVDRSAAISASPGLARQLARDLRFAPGDVVDHQMADGVIKFVTRLIDGHRIESVIIPMDIHDTVCVSSQVGCRMGCSFCATGRMGLVRNLTAEEIVGQVYAARRRFGRSARNVVFMGMGEPLDNCDAVCRAIRVINDQRGFDVPLRRITLSTAGWLPGIAMFADSGLLAVKLAVSLNAPDDALRDRLMPVNRNGGMEALARSIAAYPLAKGRRVMIAYVLIAGINDSPAQARALADWLAPLPVKVNLIAMNPIAEHGMAPPAEAAIETFRKTLIDRGVIAQYRHSRGRTILAACGQLGSQGIRC